MFFPENLKRSIHVASRSVNESGVQIYGEPKEYEVNCQNVLPTSASAELETFGTSVDSLYQIVGDSDYLKDIKEFDRVYVDVEPPSEVDPLAAKADYTVYRPPCRFPNVTTVYLKRLKPSNG